jgi:hypothetical protein
MVAIKVMFEPVEPFKGPLWAKPAVERLKTLSPTPHTQHPTLYTLVLFLSFGKYFPILPGILPRTPYTRRYTLHPLHSVRSGLRVQGTHALIKG